MASQKSRTSARNKADKLFSLLVRSVGYCQRCGATGRLETSHVLSRRYSNTRCDFRNAFAMCSSCHRWLGANPLGHAEFFIEWHAERFMQMGSDRLTAENMARGLRDELQVLAYSGEKVDWFEVRDGLAAQAKAEGLI